MIYVVADKITGKIVKHGTCPESMLSLQANADQVAIDVTDSLAWTGDDQAAYYSGGVILARSPMTTTIPATASIGVAMTVTGPPGASLSIDGVGVGVLDATGSESVTLTDAGVYTFTLTLWPWLDTTASVTAA